MKRSLLAAALAGVLVGGCEHGISSAPAGKGTTIPTATRKPRGVIGLSVLTLTNPFFKDIADSLTAEAARRGYEVVAVSGEFDPAKQHNQVKDFIIKKVAAIVLCPCDSKAVGPAIQEANEAGIPVFTADIACLAPGAKVVTHVATDNYEGGKQAGNAMIEALGEAGGKIAILDHKPVESCQLRVKGFKEVLAAHNEKATGKITIVAELPGGGVKEQGHRAAADLLQAHPNLAGIFAINDPSALGARAALEEAGKEAQVKIVAFDGQPEGKKAIKDGKIYADPVQYPDRIGRETALAIVRYFEGETVPPEVLILTGLYRRADAAKDPSPK
jgi:ribose transport system substrate-binding protein